MFAVVPLAGAGTSADPKRPAIAPAVGNRMDQMLSWSWLPSDDGQFAIVEFVARSRSVLTPVLADSRVVKAFEKGRHKPEDIEKELQKYAKKFSLKPPKEKK